jgi:hypothetical protein
MATFAKLADDGKTVVNILAFDIAKTTKNHQTNEEVGQGYLYRNHGWPAELWKISEIEKGIPYRKNFANIGYTYDSTRDAFITPQPYPSWILNETTCQWEAPIPRPDDEEKMRHGVGKIYHWDEENQTWVGQEFSGD